MNTASEYVKFGGCMGFTSIFLLVLIRDRDIVAAVFDGSVACIIMAFAFKLLHDYTISLHNQVVREKKAFAQQQLKQSNDTDRKSLSNGGIES